MGYQTGMRIQSERHLDSGLFCLLLHVNFRCIYLGDAYFHVCATEMISAFPVSQDFVQAMIPSLCIRQQHNWRILRRYMNQYHLK